MMAPSPNCFWMWEIANSRAFLLLVSGCGFVIKKFLLKKCHHLSMIPQKQFLFSLFVEEKKSTSRSYDVKSLDFFIYLRCILGVWIALFNRVCPYWRSSSRLLRARFGSSSFV